MFRLCFELLGIEKVSIKIGLSWTVNHIILNVFNGISILFQKGNIFTISFYFEKAVVLSMFWLCFKLLGFEKVLITVGLSWTVNHIILNGFKWQLNSQIIFTYSFHLENAVVLLMLRLCFKLFGIEKVLIKVSLPWAVFHRLLNWQKWSCFLHVNTYLPLCSFKKMLLFCQCFGFALNSSELKKYWSKLVCHEL